MTVWKLILRSLWFYRRTHTGVFLGTAVGIAALVGALTVGDSVRHSLRQTALARLGDTAFVLTAGERFFRAGLAKAFNESLQIRCAPILQLRGHAIGAGKKRANGVQVIGVDRRFWRFARESVSFTQMGEEEAVVNLRLATKLGLRPGDSFLIRMEKAHPLPEDVPLTSDATTQVALRLRVKAVAGENALGSFQLRANQIPPYNVFLPLPWLSRVTDRPGRANVLLIAEKRGSPLKEEILRETLRSRWGLEDAGLAFRDLIGPGAVELRSEQVFIDPPVEEAALGVGGGVGVFTYFVNRLRSGEKSTPYSFVSAPGPGLIPEGMADDEILINDWLAEDLGVSEGASLELTYFVIGAMGRLVEESTVFRVRSVVPLEGIAADRDLMPDFPGLADVDSCEDWDPGIPIDLDRIRDKDEVYWDSHRGTPKAFVTLSAAQRMWGNRFGRLTAVRYPHEKTDVPALEAELLKGLTPASLGFGFIPVREKGLEAGKGAVDFGQLFLGLGFFIILAALILTGLLFVFNVEQREEETGVLLALGFPPGRVRTFFLAEGAVIAIFGAAAGTALGVLYTGGILLALGSLWIDVVGTTALRLHVEIPTLVMGAGVGVLFTLAAVWLANRRQASRPVHSLQRGEGDPSKGGFLLPLAGAGTCLVGAVILLALVDPGRGREAAGAFFGAGTLMLAAGLFLCNALWIRASRSVKSPQPSLARLGMGNILRRRGRSLSIVGTLACGVFVVASVGANRHDPARGANRRESGTGGYALFGETSLPVLRDLNTEAGKSFYKLNREAVAGASFVHIRVQEGDDASCLNLNRVEQPRILGVDPKVFSASSAFTFAKTEEIAEGTSPWLALEKRVGEDVIPAIADQTVIDWGLKLSLGDTLSYVDEKGKPFRLKLVGGLANSIFQGHVLISETAFMKRFPSTNGARILLIDAPAGQGERVADALSRALQDLGLALTPAGERLASFYAVENTYLSIFLLLGGLGLLLGNVGLGVVVMRNVLERRQELALFRAVGFSRAGIRRMILWVHGFLFAVGCL
ncbi:MAG: FtsX-like permease family protein, partial [Planctomycetota bacterium]